MQNSCEWRLHTVELISELITSAAKFVHKLGCNLQRKHSSLLALRTITQCTTASSIQNCVPLNFSSKFLHILSKREKWCRRLWWHCDRFIIPLDPNQVEASKVNRLLRCSYLDLHLWLSHWCINSRPSASTQFCAQDDGGALRRFQVTWSH